MCWVALDRGAMLAELHGWTDRVLQWRTIAEEIRADVGVVSTRSHKRVLVHHLKDAGAEFGPKSR